MTLEEIAKSDLTPMHNEAINKAKIMACSVITTMFDEFEHEDRISRCALHDLKDAVKVLYMIKELKKV